MRVAMYYSNKDVRLEEKPKPVIGPGEILVRIESSGICGTDCLEWYRIHRVPLVLGHEIAGVVAETGRGVKRFKTGDRVAVSHHVPCGKCRFCKDGHETVCDTLRKTNFDPGGFSEFVRVPKINVDKGTYLLPKDVTFDEATFIEPLACVIRGQRLAGFSEKKKNKGKSALVIGSGISGLLHIQLAKVNGIGKVFTTDVVDYRLGMAKKFGADHAINAREYTPELLKSKNGGMLADLVVVCTGATQAMDQAMRSIEKGGTILFFAAAGKGVSISLPVNDIFWRNEVTLTSSYAGSPQDHLDALKLISSRKIDVCDMISHKFGLADAANGFALVSEAGDSMKVIIEPQK
ncbi:MAG: zinc-dependent dehydrogenase [Candidatus Omnitrophica bacterium]|nr:zinc-dependent dehydrogenase [Candidatus Omnitrophota bacterium]